MTLHSYPRVRSLSVACAPSSVFWALCTGVSVSPPLFREPCTSTDDERLMGTASSIVASSSARAFAVVVEASRRSARAALRYHYRTRFKACGANVRFDPASSRIDDEHVRVGSNVFLGAGAVIGRADIGDDVMFGPNVHIRDGNHRYNVLGKTIQDSGDGEPGLVVIASDVWIGDGTTVIRGGSVGEGSVIGTRSLVTKSDPCLCNRRRYPSRCVLKLRFEDDELREHLRHPGRQVDEAERMLTERARVLSERADEGLADRGLLRSASV